MDIVRELIESITSEKAVHPLFLALWLLERRERRALDRSLRAVYEDARARLQGREQKKRTSGGVKGRGASKD